MLPSLRVLLAEDAYANQVLAVGLLKKRGHTVTVANNGKEVNQLLDEAESKIFQIAESGARTKIDDRSPPA